MLEADPDNPRGLKPLDVSCVLEDGAQQDGAAYELYAVVQHLGATPFSGHYVAHLARHRRPATLHMLKSLNFFVQGDQPRYCWHPPSASWWCFDDSSVRRVDKDRTDVEGVVRT